MATEKRLIDANALYSELSTLSMMVTGLRAGKGVLNEFMKQYRESVLRVVDEQPTVDAVEVVHGRIEDVEIVPNYMWKYRCSCCQSDAERWYKYCPNCGAKMDGDGNG